MQRPPQACRMQRLGFPGAYRGRCSIDAPQSQLSNPYENLQGDVFGGGGGGGGLF